MKRHDRQLSAARVWVSRIPDILPSLLYSWRNWRHVGHLSYTVDGCNHTMTPSFPEITAAGEEVTGHRSLWETSAANKHVSMLKPKAKTSDLCFGGFSHTLTVFCTSVFCGFRSEHFIKLQEVSWKSLIAPVLVCILLCFDYIVRFHLKEVLTG